jgi:hypothetical protein
VPEWLGESVTKVLSPEPDVSEQAVVERAQLLLRTGVLAPPPDGGDDPQDYRQQRDMPRLCDPWSPRRSSEDSRWSRRCTFSSIIAASP